MNIKKFSLSTLSLLLVLTLVSSLVCMNISASETGNDDITKIKTAWQALTCKPEVVLDNFYAKTTSNTSWHNYTNTATVDIEGISHVVVSKPADVTGLVIMCPPTDNKSVNKPSTVFKINDFEELYLWYTSDTEHNNGTKNAVQIGYGIAESNKGAFGYADGLIKSESDFQKIDILDYYNDLSEENKKNFNGETYSFTRVHFDFTPTDVVVSQVMGVRKIDFANEFDTDITDDTLTADWGLIKWVIEASKVEFSNYNNGEALKAVIDTILNHNPDVKAACDLADSTNNLKQMHYYSKLADSAGKATTATAESDPLQSTVNKDLFERDITKAVFTGSGATLSTDCFVRYTKPDNTVTYSDYDVYLAYYIPEDVTATNVIMQTLFRGKDSKGNSYNNNTTGAVVNLDARGKWTLLNSADLKGADFDKITAPQDVLIQVNGESGKEITIYFSRFVFTKKADLKYENDFTAEEYLQLAETIDENSSTDKYLNEEEFLLARNNLKAVIYTTYPNYISAGFTLVREYLLGKKDTLKIEWYDYNKDKVIDIRDLVKANELITPQI